MASFVSSMSTPMTSPAIAAYCRARCDRPPTPKMATVSPGTTPATLIAVKVVTPAQVNGASSRELTSSGTGVANAAGATAYSANVPSTRARGHVGPVPLDHADTLMPGDERRRQFDRPVTVRCMDIDVTEPAGLHPYQHLSGAGCGDGEILDLQRAWKSVTAAGGGRYAPIARRRLNTRTG